MKSKNIKVLFIFVFILFSGNLQADIIDDLKNLNLNDPKGFLCENLGLNQVLSSECGIPDIGFSEDDFKTIATGRFVISSYGCGDKVYSDDPKSSKNNYNVALLGDSLTHFGGPSEIWELYLGQIFKPLALGAAGATSSAWREHFDNCEAYRDDIGFWLPKKGRLQLPPRSMMMIGGNDFHVFKGILQPLWWAVDFRHNSVLNNVEKIITHHHKGNNGCGDDPAISPLPGGGCPDVDGNGIVNYQDWGRGRLFVSLGNIPAVSVDPTDPKLIFILGQLYSLGLMSPLAFDENTESNVGANQYKGMNILLYVTRRHIDSYIDVILKPAQDLIYEFDRVFNPNGVNKGKANHAWASREMHLLQNRISEVWIRRSGFMYVHMYKYFRDSAADARGCYWCADWNLWMDDNDLITIGDGIHISHVKGYTRWAQTVIPYMALARMDIHKRTDIFGPPGAEVTNRDECDDLCLLLLCFYFKMCKI